MARPRKRLSWSYTRSESIVEVLFASVRTILLTKSGSLLLNSVTDPRMAEDPVSDTTCERMLVSVFRSYPPFHEVLEEDDE